MVSRGFSLYRLFHTIFIVSFVTCGHAFSQCKPKIKIDGVEIIADMDEQYGLHLPYWLKAGQTLAIGASVSKISVLEFSIDTASNSLLFSKVLSINSTSPVTVPSAKAWKIESIAKVYNPSSYTMATYSSPGTYTFTIPSCAENICIEIWGAGGGGGYSSCYNFNNCWSSGAGGGGAFGNQCFAVTPNQTLTVTVGKGGTAAVQGEASSVVGANINVVANGGAAGTSSVYATFDGTFVVAAGGTCTATNNLQGGNSIYTTGGAGGNGGSGGVMNSNGSSPGGGGGGAGGNGGGTPGVGGNGKVVISW